MDTIEDIKLYLPQYLSSSEKDVLIKELRKFPTNGTKDTIYTSCNDNIFSHKVEIELKEN